MRQDIKKISAQHKYCFICGKRMIFKGGHLLKCSNCGYRKYVNPVPANGAILENDKKELLLVRRKVEPKKGFWDVPGGFVDPNEDLEESMIRELKEELGIRLNNLKYFTSTYDLYKFDGITLPILGLIFVGHIKNQRLVPTDDISGFKFFKKEKIPYEKLAFEGLKKVFKKYVSHR